MKSIKMTFPVFPAIIFFGLVNFVNAQSLAELPLWPNGIKNNPVQYNE